MTFRAPLVQKRQERDWSASIGAQVGALALALTAGIALRPFTKSDWPNPARASDRIANRTQPESSGALRFSVAPKPFAQSDWPNPSTARRLSEGLTVSDSALVGQDQFFGGPGQPPPSRDWPNPTVRIAPRQDFIGSSVRGAGAIVAPPFIPSDYPNPQTSRGYFWRDFVAGVPLALVGKDVLAFRQSDWPTPRVTGRALFDVGSPALRVISFVQPPFAQLDWPNPRAKAFPAAGDFVLRSVPIGGAQPFRVSDWPVPPGSKRGVDLLTWAPCVISPPPPPEMPVLAFARTWDSAPFLARASDTAPKAGATDT